VNLVVGATGLLGSEICRLLAAQNKPVRALVRSTSDEAKVAELEGLNIEIARGDLKDRPSLDAACRGAATVISTASSTLSRQDGDSIQTVDLEGQLNLIDAASSANVDRFVLVSFPEVDVEFPLQSAKRRAEEHLKKSGLTYTILQPTFFMEVWLGPHLGFDAANSTARIYGSGENKISYISYRDVAKFAVAALDSETARNAVIKLGGPEALSPLEVVRTFEAVQGRKFDVEHVPESALIAQKDGAADPIQQSFAGLMLYYSRGDTIDMHETLQKFPVSMTSVRDFAQAG
jgi:NADH dehydrogenase